MISKPATARRPRWQVLVLAAGLALPTIGQADEPGEQPARPGKVVDLGNGQYRVGAVSFDRPKREIRFPAKVNMTEGLLEYAIVTENGKVHESLLVTSIRPLNLNIAILLLGYKESKAVLNPSLPQSRRFPEAPAAATAKAQLDVALEWSDNGKPRRAPIETWLRTLPDNKPAIPGPFIYTASEIIDGQFVAEYDGNIVALYLDPTSVFNNPRPGNFDDETWTPAERIPDIGTDVTVILSPHQTKKTDKPD